MRFSVIVPLYNKAPYVRKALQSILNQTFLDFELIVIDDGSTDNSFEVAEQVLKNSCVRYQLIHQENTGVSTSRNNGVAKSCGDFICFLDADDWWERNFLERMDWLINEFPDAGIYGANYFIYNRGKERIALHIPKTGYINYCDCYRNMQMPIWTGCACIPSSLFVEMNGFKPQLKLGEDFDLWIRIALRHKVAYLDEPLACYFQDSDPQWRLVGKLHKPSEHMLWNLGYLEEEERRNPDYKRLIDELRVYSLMPYYLSFKYRDDAKRELIKVAWDMQPACMRWMYRMPIPILKSRKVILSLGARIKQSLIALIG